ncbi:MAG TPA: AMP-binding protein [Pseudonocardiaceae bacterium]|nr:AMP-binding protein [Pseudonocardiaceae bacterium]
MSGPLAHAGRVLLRLAGPRQLPGIVRALRQTRTSPATVIRIAALCQPHSPGLIDERGTLTFADLDDAGARLAAGLADRHGVQAGGTVAIMCRNHRGFVIGSLAAGWLGADLVYLNTEFSARQIAQAIANPRPDLVIADAEFLPRFAGTPVPVVVGWPEPDIPDHSTVDDLVLAHDRLPPVGRVRAGTITILSSGTTGEPKGAPRKPNTRSLLGPLVTLLGRCRLTPGEPILIAPPLFHGLGLVVWTLAGILRSPVVLRRGFDPLALLSDVDCHRAAMVAAVPVMLQRVLALPDEARARHRHDSLRTVLSGGAPLRPELAERLLAAFGDVLFNGYGSTETGIAAVATPADLRAAPGTVGRPTLGVPVRVLDADRRPAPIGQTGEIFVGGPLVFSGYSGGGSKETAHGLMNSGDLGHFDAHGRLFVDGRADDMIVSGGENVYPQEVEDILARHPRVADAAVIGVDDTEFGQRLVAYLVPRGQRPEPAELAAYVKDNLARYKVPRDFVFLDALPRNATGKLLRRQLPGEGERL